MKAQPGQSTLWFLGLVDLKKKKPTVLGLSCSITNTAISNCHFSKVLLTGHYLLITLINLKNLFIPLESCRAHRLWGSQWYKNDSLSFQEFMVAKIRVFFPPISSTGFRGFLKDIQYEEQLGETMHKLCCNHRTAKTWAAELKEDGQWNAIQ